MQRSQREPPAPLEDTPPAPDVATVRVRLSSSNSHLATAMWVVAALVVLAVLKPWGAGAPIETARPFVPVPTVVAITPAPTEDRSADGLASPICLGSGGWRIATLERWQTQDVRVWRAIEPVATATGPLDPAIPAVPVVALEVTALGWCAPAYGDGRPEGPATVTAWSVVSGRTRELQLEQVRPIDGTTPIAALYVAVTVCPEPTNCLPLLPSPAPRSWATERVVFRYHDAGLGGDAWFAADVTILPRAAAPSPSPVSGAAAPGASRTRLG